MIPIMLSVDPHHALCFLVFYEANNLHHLSYSHRLGSFVTPSQHERLNSSAKVSDLLSYYCRALSHNSSKGTDVVCVYLNTLLLWAPV